jgi:hypothetical protein
MKGQAAWKEGQYPPAHGKIVGIDFGPSQIGIFSEAGGAKLELAEGLHHDYARIRRLQRYLDRSRRATNPDNYNPDGTIRRGIKPSRHKSQRYRKAQAKLADLWRGYAAHRKNLLGELANKIITHGTTIKIEKLSYKAWQKQWGTSIGRGAPGMLVAMLRCKARQVGGELIEFPTRHTKFSQLCHHCGTYKKKPLSLRKHTCECGIGPFDRDTNSAFLANCYDPTTQALDSGVARAAFAVLQCGADAIQGISTIANALPSVAELLPRVGGKKSDPSAKRALRTAQIPAGDDAGKRLLNIPPNFQEDPLHLAPASIAAGMNPPGDARSPQSQKTRHASQQAARGKPPRAPTKRRYSQKGTQLWLFEGL